METVTYHRSFSCASRTGREALQFWPVEIRGASNIVRRFCIAARFSDDFKAREGKLINFYIFNEHVVRFMVKN